MERRRHDCPLRAHQWVPLFMYVRISSVQGSPGHRGGFWCCQIGARKRIRVHARVNSRLHQILANQVVTGSYAIPRSQEPTKNADLETCDICVLSPYYHGPSSGCIFVYWRPLHRLMVLMVHTARKKKAPQESNPS